MKHYLTLHYDKCAFTLQVKTCFQRNLTVFLSTQKNVCCSLELKTMKTLLHQKDKKKTFPFFTMQLMDVVSK